MSYNILIVEDDEGLRNIYQTMLNMAGYQVRAVGDGEEALKILETAPPDLMTLDINLPSMSGLSLLRHARQRLGLMELKIIMLTANIVAAHSEYTTMVDATLEKPTGVDHLLRVCRQLLEDVKTN